MKKQIHTSENKTDAYIAAVLLFNQVKLMSHSKIGGWFLRYVYTSNSDQHFITEYSNGKLRVKAESIEGNHTYTIQEELKEGDDNNDN